MNRGGDDPAGLIVGERLRSEQSRLEAAIGNSERADQVVNIAEGGLTEISSLLLEAQSLVSQNGNDAGLSADEKEANQQQIDQIIATSTELRRSRPSMVLSCSTAGLTSPRRVSAPT